MTHTLIPFRYRHCHCKTFTDNSWRCLAQFHSFLHSTFARDHCSVHELQPKKKLEVSSTVAHFSRPRERDKGGRERASEKP